MKLQKGHNKYNLKLIGILFTKETRWYKAFGYFKWILMTVWILPVLFFTLALMRDLEKFAQNLSTSFGSVNSCYKSFILFWHRKDVKELLIKIQTNFDERISLGRADKRFVTANQVGNLFARISGILMVTAGVSSVFGPALITILNLVRGTLAEDMFKMRVEARLLYSVENLYVFYMCYLATPYMATMYTHTVAAADSFFLSFGVAIIACVQDLMHQFSEIDDNKERLQTKLTNNRELIKRIQKEIIKCVEYHNKVHSVVKQFQTVVGPIVSGQFFFSLFLLGTMLFVTVIQHKFVKIVTQSGVLCNWVFACLNR